jgi:F-type H+-transporting ATPase subunit b
MQDLLHLPDNQMQLIRSASAIAIPMKVTSAYPLAQAQREDLCQACRALAGREVTCEFFEDRNLIAGLRISFGSWVLRANVQDELNFFTEPLRHA